MSKNRVLTLSLLGAAIFGAAFHPVLAQSGPTTVRIMTWEGAATNQSIMTAMAAFMRANPDIKVELVNVPAGGYDQARNGLIQAKQLPDLFWVGNDQALEYGAQGILYDWSKYAAKPGALNFARFAPGSVENYRLGGKLYGLPSLLNTYGYYYNADLFAKAGVPLPRAGWTYKQFFDAAQKLTVKDGDKTTRYGVYSPQNDAFALSQYAVSAGGAPFADRIQNSTKVSVSPQMVEGATLWANAIKAGTVTPRTYPGDGLTELFAAGKAPMLGGGQWLTAGYIDQKLPFKWGFAPMPIVKQPAHILDVVGIASPAYIKNPDAVWKVLTYLDSRAWESVLPSAPVAPAAYVPSSSPYFARLRAAGVPSVAESVGAMISAPKKVGVRFLAPWSGKANDLLSSRYNDVLSGKVAPKAGLDQLAADLNTLISQNR